MSKPKRKFLAVLAVLCCALLCLGAALMIPKNKTVNALPSANNANNVSNLVASSNNGTIVFSSENLKKLYKNITGSADAATYDEVKKKLNTSGGVLTAANMVSSATSEFTVKFGSGDGDVWIPTYLSTAETGDIILTLWLADSEGSAKFSTWSNNTGGNPPYNTKTDRLPGIYGTSYVRAYLTGKDYANASSGVLTEIAPYEVSRWADFANTWGAYLVEPKYVPWQKLQDPTKILFQTSDNAYVTTYVPNDSLGKLTESKWYKDSSYPAYIDMADLQDKDGYNSWGEDKVWLPSVTETGLGTYTALWRISSTQRNSSAKNWLRSCANGNTYQCRRLDPNAANTGISTFDDVTTPLAVRPAIHLNLTQAEKARGVDFGTNDTTPDTEGSTKTATLTATYSDNDVTINVPDFSRITAVGTDISYYKDTTGEFTVKEPDTDGDKTYEITVTPKSGYYWDDTKDANPRKYKITIERADIAVNWTAKTVAAGQSLLNDSNLITVIGGTTVQATISQQFYKVEPGGSETPPDDWLTNGGWDVQWESRNDSSAYFKANQTGTYSVYYEIDAIYHNTKRGSYTVTVSADSVHISTNSGVTISNEIFGGKTVDRLKSYLKDNFADWVTVSSESSGTYSGQALQTLLSKLEVVLLDDYGMEVVPDAGNDEYSYYSAGTYSLGLQYIPTLPSSEKTLAFVWDTDKPRLTIEKLGITVNIVLEDPDGSFEHIYGDDDLASMTYELENENDIPQGEDFDDLLIRKGLFRLKGTTTELNSRTPAGTYDIEGAAWESNYVVNFASVSYKVKPRPITLQIKDKEVGYGTDLSGNPFEMTKVEGSFVFGDTLDVLAADAEFSLWQNGDVAFSTTLAMGKYELRATIPTGNYVFTVNPGTLTITTADFDMSGVKFENAGYIYDGQPHKLEYSGTLPSDEISVSYRYVNYENGEELDGPPTDVGLYIVYASFSHSNLNYNAINDKVAYLRIALNQEGLNQGFPELPSDEDLAQKAADLARKKQEAKKDLEDVAQNKKDEIDNSALSDEEKAQKKAEVDAELQKGKDAIDSATSESGVDSAFNEAKKKIEDIGKAEMAAAELEKKKKAAKDELEQAAKDKNAEINGNEELTDEEKAEAKKKVEEELQKGKDAIDSATDASGVESAQSTSKANIENIKGIHKEDSSFPWWIIALIAGVLALVAVLIIVIVKRRQTADGDDDYDDYYDDEYDFDEEIEEDEDFGDDY